MSARVRSRWVPLLAKRIALLLASFGLVLAVFEVALRHWLPSADFGGDPQLASRYHPYRTLRYASKFGEFDVESRYNSVGMRDREHAREPSDKRRVLVLGDSFMEAKQVAFARSFPAELERLLSQRRPSEVINTGRSGFGTIEQYLVLRHFGVSRHPEVVVQAFFMNDVHDDLSVRDRVEFDEAGRPLRMRNSGMHLRIGQLVTEQLSRLQLLRKNKLVDADTIGYLARDPFAIVRKGGAIDDASQWRGTLRCLEETAQLSREIGAAYLLVLIPLGQQVDARLHDAVSEAWSLEPEKLGRDPQERLVQFGREKGIAVLDLLPVLARQSDRKLYYAHDGHWTPDAHRIAAEATLAAIEGISAGAPTRTRDAEGKSSGDPGAAEI